jgi:hypothetical protein
MNGHSPLVTDPMNGMEILLGLVAILAGVAWGAFLLYRYVSVRNALLEKGDVHIRITMRGTEIAVWREEHRGGTVREINSRPVRRVS